MSTASSEITDYDPGFVPAWMEQRKDSKNVLRDSIIGFADGLTVPFALTAGLSSLGSSKLVVIGGLAELFSGSISMGLGAYLAMSTEAQQYDTAAERQHTEITKCPDEEAEQVFRILCGFGPERDDVAPFVEALKANPDGWVRFTMQYGLNLEKPRKMDAYLSAITMGLAYFLGGLLPMIPYFVINTASTALWYSVGLTALILLIFGYVKSVVSGCTVKQSTLGALQTLCVGAAAAGASYGIVRLVDSKS